MKGKPEILALLNEPSFIQNIGDKKDNEYLIRTDASNVSAKEFTPRLDQTLES